jgi:hypothetical protein
MRIEKDSQENPSRKEETFKASKKTKTKEYKTSDNSYSESNAKEANYARKLKRGSGKYKGKLPFKFFNCGEVGHFVAKCPYAKIKNNNKEEDSSFKRYKKGNTENRRKFYRQRKNLYTNEDNNSSDDIDNEMKEILFKALETPTEELENRNTDSTKEDNLEVDAEVDLEGDLICTLNETEISRNKKWIQKEKLKKYIKQILCTKESSNEIEKIIISLKTQVEEAKRIE